MTAVLTRARAELRARIKPMLALTLLVGIGGAAVMTLAAGARRTDTAYPRFARAYKAADMFVYPQFDTSFAKLDFNAVAHLPQVAVSSVQHFMFAQPNQLAIVASEPPFGTEINGFKLLGGRLLDPSDPTGALVPLWVAEAKHWHVGSAVTIGFGARQGEPIPTTLHVRGIEASPGEFPPQISGNSPTSGGGQIHVPLALYRELQPKNVFTFDFLLLRLKHGNRDVAALNEALNRMANDKPQLNDNLNTQAADVQRSIHLQAVALWLVAGLVALIIVLVLSQLLARQATIDSVEGPTLQALGMTRAQVWLTGMGRALAIGLGGAVIGVIVAYFASTLMPIGIARVAEPRPGFSFDSRLLIVAALSVVALVLLLAAWPIWRSTRLLQKQPARAARPSLVARTAAAPGLSPAISTGVRLALESGKGRTEVPVRSSLFSVILAIVALAGALTFGASLDHLLSSPRLYGWNWDVHLTTNDAYDNSGVLPLLQKDPRVEDVSNVDNPPAITSDKVRFDLDGLDQYKGRIDPVLISGRVPQLPNEIALGVKTLHDTHKKIGDSITLTISALESSVPSTFKIVGSVVLPPNSSSAPLGTGAALSEAGIRTMTPPGFTIPPPSDLYFTFAPGVDKKAALADLMSSKVQISAFVPGSKPTKKTEEMSDAYGVVLPTKPTDLVNFGNVQNLPLLLAGLLGLLAAATLAHTLVTSIRRRRRDLAILKMLGFVPRQVRWAVAWQATTFVSVALLIGLPVGIAIGRVVWTAFATNLGTLPEPVTPSLKLLLTIPGAIVLANLIAIAPAYVAGRMRPAPALRAE